MAIIYTYPKLQNPQGNELIVVTDVNNKNATRLITIASIASLVPGGGGGGCSSAIAGILTGAGDYIPPLCNEVTFAGSGIDISADQASATVTFTATPYELPCANITTLGGIKAWPITGLAEPPEPADTGTYYPVQVLTQIDPEFNCTGVVRIPDSQSYQLPCSTDVALGGIKTQNNQTQLSVPSVADTGTYYPIEVMKNAGVVTGTDCTAIVKVPSVELTCATPTVLGGIKASKAPGVEVPEPANSGTYYPVQTTESQQDDDCTAIVRIPDASINCATTDTIGGVIVADNTVEDSPVIPEVPSTNYALQVNTECEAFVAVPNTNVAQLTSTQSGGTNADPNLTVTEGAQISNVQVTGGTDISVTRNSDTEITIASTATGAIDYLIKAVTHSTTITTTTNPSRFPLPQLTASTTPFAQIKFTPSSVTGTNNDVFTVFKRPQNAEHYVKIVVKCTVLTADDDDISDERYLMGLHHSTTDVTGANLSYNYQVTGDYDLDDLTSGDQLNQIQFTWYIQVGDLLNAEGETASSGEDCYIYVKALYDSTSAANAPSIILGRQWNVNPTTTQGTIEAAGPLEICAYEIPNTKYENNPAQPG